MQAKDNEHVCCLQVPKGSERQLVSLPATVAAAARRVFNIYTNLIANGINIRPRAHIVLYHKQRAVAIFAFHH